MTITVADFFCGAGGSSTGAVQVPGIEVVAAANHWQLAVDTHNTNHPDAAHICADLSQYDPRYFPASDIGWFSPECTNHSQAKGKKRALRGDAQPDLFGEVLPDAAAERSRATMWDVVRFTEHFKYRIVITENVIEAAAWALFDAWIQAMRALGYRHRLVMLNSMHAQLAGAGAAQSRDRMYVVFWREGDREPDLERLVRPEAVCPQHGVVRAMQSFKRPGNTVGRYRSQYLLRCPRVECRNQPIEPLVRPAEDIIDWTNLGQRIGDRDKALAEKTLARIRAGIERYWRPMLIEAAGNTYDAADPRHPAHGRPDGYMRAWPVDEPVRTVHTTASKALVVPVEGREGKQAQAAGSPLRTMTTRNETGLAFLTQFRDRVRDLDPAREPLNTVVADGANHALVRATPSFIAELRGGGSTARPVSDPLCTVTASGNHHALIMRNNGVRGGHPARHTTPAEEPIRTITTAGHQSLLNADRPTVNLDDVRFRMLEPREIISAMDFPSDYVVLGNRREQVRMAGNAVTPCAARDIFTVVSEVFA